MLTMGQRSSKASALCIQTAHCSAPLPLVNLKHVDHCIHTTHSTGFHTPCGGKPGHAIRPTTVSKDPHWLRQSICVNISVCWTSYLSRRDWKRQQYELIYFCNVLWLSLCLIPSTPRNFLDRPRLSAFQEDTSLWHKDVFTWCTFWLQNQHSTTYAPGGKQEKTCTH